MASVCYTDLPFWVRELVYGYMPVQTRARSLLACKEDSRHFGRDILIDPRLPLLTKFIRDELVVASSMVRELSIECYVEGVGVDENEVLLWSMSDPVATAAESSLMASLTVSDLFNDLDALKAYMQRTTIKNIFVEITSVENEVAEDTYVSGSVFNVVSVTTAENTCSYECGDTEICKKLLAVCAEIMRYIVVS